MIQMIQGNRKKIRAAGVALYMALLLASPFVSGIIVQAAAEVNLRIISTTDIHNQLSVEYYDNAGEKSKGSLAKAYTLIKQARAATSGASITVDVGDSIYGYGSDYIYKNAPDALQPIYGAMSEIGYDAITLGNHDFDYGVPYIKKQVSLAGFDNICTVANVYDAITGKNVWKDYLMIRKECPADDGKTYSVDIAIVGVTRPALSNYSTHTGELTTADMVEVVTEKAAKAKEEGADIVIVIAHTGIGKDNPALLSENEGYALSCIKDVDAVMCGHLHQNYPSTDFSARQYYQLPGVDQKTGLANGKPIIMIQDRGRGIGISDLKLKIGNDGFITVKSASCRIEYCQESTKEADEILKYKDSFDAKIKDTYEEIVAELASGAGVNNYFGFLNDTLAMQIGNESRIREGILYKAKMGQTYKDYHVIAAGTYTKTGAEGKNDYLNFGGVLTIQDLLGIQSYNRDYVVVYRMTGAQLREWLEWSAGLYGYWNSVADYSDAKLRELITASGLSSFFSPTWMENWKYFAVFDGIEYTFDMSVAPRYNRYGEVLNSSASRVRNLTCNGEPVTDEMQFLLVAQRNIVYNNPVVGSTILNQRVYNTQTYLVNQLQDYVSELGSYGAISLAYEDNWNVSVPGNTYIMRSSEQSKSVAEQQPWYHSIMDETDQYVYYKTQFPDTALDDVSGPTLVIASTNKVKTNRDVTVAVQATDRSGVSVLKYTKGQYAADDPIWGTKDALDISGNSFTVTENGVYTVCAKDAHGNATVRHITLENMNRTILQVPDLNTYTNKKKEMTGTAEPGATVYVEAPNGVSYMADVLEDGTFSCAMPCHNSGTLLYVYVMDKQGRRSDKVEVTVVDNGPNYPDVDELTNKGKYITGTLNDESYCQIFAVIGSKVYVNGESGRKAYINSKKYSQSKTIVESSYSLKNGKFSLKVAVQDTGKIVKVYSVDTIGRVSALNQITVSEVAPNKPTVYKVCDAENIVTGKIPGVVSGSAYTVTLQIDEQTYTTTPEPNGFFKFETGELEEGTALSVKASDEVDGKSRVSVKTNSEVVSYEDYQEKNMYLTFNTITNKDTILSGSVGSASYKEFLLKIGSAFYTVPIENQEFHFTLEQPLADGTMMYAVLREPQGALVETKAIKVMKAIPDMPEIVTQTIYNNSKTIKVRGNELCTAYVKIGSQLFSSDEPVYSTSDYYFTYTIKVSNLSAKEEISIYLQNSAGKSKSVHGVVKGRKPEIRKVNKITYKQKTLNGRVGLYLDPDKGLKTATVKNTGTKVFAKTGGVVYKGTVKKDGTFKVKFPKKLKKGKKIKVYATNEFGGKSKVVTVTVK